MNQLQKDLKHMYVISAHGNCLIKNNKLVEKTVPKNIYLIFTSPLGCIINNTPKKLSQYFSNLLKFIYRNSKSPKFTYATILKPGDKYVDLQITTNKNISHKGYHYIHVDNPNNIETLFGKYSDINYKLSNIINNHTNNKNNKENAVLLVDTCRTILTNCLTLQNQGRVSLTNNGTQYLSKNLTLRKGQFQNEKKLAQNIAKRINNEFSTTEKITGKRKRNT
tara:strand:- start:86 stop:751 length:666 start_codon:yes stop_codon:yes gene_type:complete